MEKVEQSQWKVALRSEINPNGRVGIDLPHRYGFSSHDSSDHWVRTFQAFQSVSISEFSLSEVV